MAIQVYGRPGLACPGVPSGRVQLLALPPERKEHLYFAGCLHSIAQ